MLSPRQRRPERRPAIILGMSANGLAVARSLGRKGIPVIGVGACPTEPGLYCRFLRAKHIAPDVQDEQEFLEFLISLAKGLADRGVLFLTADEYVLFCSRYREELSTSYDFNLPSHDVIECFLDKEKTFQFASRNNIPHPVTKAVTSETALKRLAFEMEYPCILKPRDAHLWRLESREQKLLVIHSPEALLQTYRDLGHHAQRVLLQQIIPGPDDHIYQYLAYCNKESEIIAEFCCQKLRQYPPHFGIACLCESRYEPRVVEQGRFLLSKIEPKGIFALEYKLDEKTDEPVFLEANLRTSFFGELPISAGVDFPYIMYRHLVDGYNGLYRRKFQEGIRLWNIDLDLGCYLRRREKGETNFYEWLKKLKAERIAHTYLAWDDLRPWTVVYARFPGKAIKRIFRQIIGDKERNKASKSRTA